MTMPTLTDSVPGARLPGIEIQTAPWHYRWDGAHNPRWCALCWVERLAVKLGAAHYELDEPDLYPPGDLASPTGQTHHCYATVCECGWDIIYFDTAPEPAWIHMATGRPECGTDELRRPWSARR